MSVVVHLLIFTILVILAGSVDPYSILGIDYKSNQAKIKSKYDKLMRSKASP